jgi:lipid-A-disaccharide synthase
MAALRRRTGGRIRFAGVGGEAMAAEGLASLFPITDLAVFGLLEVVPRIPRLFRRIRQTAAMVRDLAPDAVITIDSPDFSARIWPRIKDRRIPLIHYVAPTVWAWRPARADRLARALDHLMVLLPFEPPFFERAGLDCSFVGHAVLESGAAHGDGAAFRARHGIAPDAPLVCVLPGSRRSEVRHLLPPFTAALASLGKRYAGLVAVIPAASAVAGEIAAAAAAWPVPVHVVQGEGEKFDAMAASQVALAASGTVALELALAGVPMVVAYRLNPLSWALVSRLVRVDYVNMINLLLDRAAVPELLQKECRGEPLAAEVARLLEDEALCSAQRTAAGEALALLAPGQESPSDRAAETVLKIIGTRD